MKTNTCRTLHPTLPTHMEIISSKIKSCISKLSRNPQGIQTGLERSFKVACLYISSDLLEKLFLNWIELNAVTAAALSWMFFVHYPILRIIFHSIFWYLNTKIPSTVKSLI